MCRTEVLRDISNQATEFTDFLPIEEKLKFAHQENEKMVKIELFQTATIQEDKDESRSENEMVSSINENSDNEANDEVLIFQVKLDNPSPQGTKISKKNICFIEIIPDDKGMNAEDEIQ